SYVGKIFKLDLATNLWDSGTLMNYPTAYFGIAANGDGSKIYIVGGTYWWDTFGDYPFPGTQVFDTSNNSSQNLSYMPSPLSREYCGATFANGSLWVLEGIASRLVDEYNEATGGWYEPNAPISDGTKPVSLTGAAVQGINGKLYVVDGGYYSLEGSVFEYTPAANSWVKKNAVDPTPRMYVSSSVWNNKIVIYGGLNSGGSVVTTATLYNPSNDTFTNYPNPNPRPTLFECGTIYGDKLYLFGGRTDPSNYNSRVPYLNILNLQTGAWSIGAAMPFAIEQASCVALNGQIYIFSGNVIIYDIATNSYSIGPSVPFPVYGSVSLLYGNKIVLDSGGLTSGEVISKIQLFDIQTGTFQIISRTMGKTHHGSVIVNGKYYSIAGEDPRHPVRRLDIANLN
ncbi:MAG: hypothetical protein N2445_06380, partial [Acidobacteria bacterium]|nr:hypothetical protein [Acidobacteriota bacterium]